MKPVSGYGPGCSRQLSLTYPTVTAASGVFVRGAGNGIAKAQRKRCSTAAPWPSRDTSVACDTRLERIYSLLPSEPLSGGRRGRIPRTGQRFAS